MNDQPAPRRLLGNAVPASSPALKPSRKGGPVAIAPKSENNYDEEDKVKLARYIAQRFVRRDNKFYQIANSGVAISAADVKRVSLHQVKVAFPEVEITDELWSAVCQHAINDTHTGQDETVSVWNRTQACLPGGTSSLVWHDGMASLNSWKKPSYRDLETDIADCTLFDELLARIFKEEVDRAVFKDWVAWNLQHEDDKPTWAVLLYSQSKGTGKSTLGRLLSLLFGDANSMPLNGVSKLTGRFNKTVLTRKFITCEEVKLAQGTDAGNKVKALISEKEIAVEGKGTNTENLQNICVFLMTTNHHPHWIEPDDRRFYVIDVNHSGHASGPDHEEFQAFMMIFYDYMKSPENIAKLRNALMAHRQANTFNPHALNVAAVDTPIMKSLTQASGQVVQQALEELIAASGKFALPQADLIKLFSEKLKVNPNRIAHMMNELGWRSHKAKWGGVDFARVVWVHPDYQVAQGRVTGPDGYDEPLSPVEDEVEII